MDALHGLLMVETLSVPRHGFFPALSIFFRENVPAKAVAFTRDLIKADAAMNVLQRAEALYAHVAECLNTPRQSLALFFLPDSLQRRMIAEAPEVTFTTASQDGVVKRYYMLKEDETERVMSIVFQRGFPEFVAIPCWRDGLVLAVHHPERKRSVGSD